MRIFLDDNNDPLRPKMGRVSDEEERLVRDLLRIRPGPAYTPTHSLPRKPPLRPGATLSDEALIARGAAVTAGINHPELPPTIVKIARQVKSRRGICELLDYLTRETRRSDIPAHLPVSPKFADEHHIFIDSSTASDRLNEWNILPDSENFRPAYRSPGARDGITLDIQSIPEQKYLHHVQAWHVVLSIKLKSDESFIRMIERLSRAAWITLDTMFGANGHRFLWCLHLDKPLHPHAHVIVEAKSKFGIRLRSDPFGFYCDTLRATFAKALASVGIHTDPSRRIDRAETRARIAAGIEPLKAGKTWFAHRHRFSNLPHRAPRWWEMNGEAALRRAEWVLTERRRAVNRPAPRHQGPTAPVTPSRAQHLEKQRAMISSEHNLVFDSISHLYVDPSVAVKSWLSLAQEGSHLHPISGPIHPNRRMANWYLLHRPELFGDLRQGKWVIPPRRELKTILRHLRIPISDRDWEPIEERQPKLDKTQWKKQVSRNVRLLRNKLVQLASEIQQRAPSSGAPTTERILGIASAAAEARIIDEPDYRVWNGIAKALLVRQDLDANAHASAAHPEKTKTWPARPLLPFSIQSSPRSRRSRPDETKTAPIKKIPNSMGTAPPPNQPPLPQQFRHGDAKTTSAETTSNTREIIPPSGQPQSPPRPRSPNRDR